MDNDLKGLTERVAELERKVAELTQRLADGGRSAVLEYLRSKRVQQ